MRSVLPEAAPTPEIVEAVTGFAYADENGTSVSVPVGTRTASGSELHRRFPDLFQPVGLDAPVLPTRMG